MLEKIIVLTRLLSKQDGINQEGQLSICLPHDLIIEIQATKDSSTEENQEELILPL